MSDNLRIAVDAFPLTLRPSGIPNYVRNVLDHVLKLDSQNRYFLYCKNPFTFEDRPNVAKRSSPSATEKSTSYGNTLWLFTKGVGFMKRDGIDIFWGTRQMLPPYLPGKIKKVLVSYDMVWHYYPETMETYNRVISKVVFKRSIKSADHIITISKASAKSLTEVVGVPEEKISVITPAGSGYLPIDKEEASGYISKKYGTNADYVLTVSTVEPRKNLTTLLKSFAGLKDKGCQLLIAGASGWKTSTMREEYERLGLTERDVKFLGHVPDEDMNKLYSGAMAFVFPSIYEGFGIPVLEAMASGTPVIVSDSSSLPEVAGEAGIIIPPLDVEAWLEAVQKVVSDGILREEMSRKGLERSKLFSWEKSAMATLKVFGNVF